MKKTHNKWSNLNANEKINLWKIVDLRCFLKVVTQLILAEFYTEVGYVRTIFQILGTISGCMVGIKILTGPQQLRLHDRRFSIKSKNFTSTSAPLSHLGQLPGYPRISVALEIASLLTLYYDFLAFISTASCLIIEPLFLYSIIF